MRHHFAALTNRGVPVLGRWKCVHCKMKVRDTAAAERLQGKPCYGE